MSCVLFLLVVIIVRFMIIRTVQAWKHRFMVTCIHPDVLDSVYLFAGHSGRMSNSRSRKCVCGQDSDLQNSTGPGQKTIGVLRAAKSSGSYVLPLLLSLRDH